MGLTSGLIAAIISAMVSIGVAAINHNRQKETQRMSVRPYLSVKMIVPPDDGIGGIPIEYLLYNLGNGIAFKPEIIDVYRTIDGNVQEGTPHISAFDYDVIIKDSALKFTVNWEHQNEIQGATDAEIMNSLVKIMHDLPRKCVLDNITIQYSDALDNRYEQIATIEYNNPDKPCGVKERISKPTKIG